MLPKFAYFKGQIVPYSEAKIGVMTHAFNYGTGAFAGVRAYWDPGQQQLNLFRPLDHFARFLNSAKLLMMDLGVSKEELTEITVQLLRTENLKENTYVRPIAYVSEEKLGVALHGLECDFTIYAIPFGQYVKHDTGAHLTFSSWRRIDDNMIPARGKLTGAYINSSFIKSEASQSGFDDALVLNADGHVSEASAMNFFIVKDGVLLTPPVSDNILEGITRRTVMELAAAELGIEVQERSIDRTEVFLAEEAFLTGTAAQIAAVTRVDHRQIGSGEMGPITAQLRDLFADLIYGRLEKYKGWLHPVYK
ncbi:MAG: branched-chain amino acid transaminase [Anaerolineales bacterium]